MSGVKEEVDYLLPTNPQYWAVVKFDDYWLKESNMEHNLPH
jgi:hypothetical protein